MEAGKAIAPFLFLLFYVLPIWLAYYKIKNTPIRVLLISIPTGLTLFLVLNAIFEDRRNENFLKDNPQINKITFKDPPSAVRDSVYQLQILMEKLPKRNDHNNVSFELDKHPERLDNFSFNWFYLGNLKFLEENDNVRSIQVTQSDLKDWFTYVDTNTRPFVNLSKAETNRFINLVKFLNRNRLSAANLKKRNLALAYHDSLVIASKMKPRTITRDTTNQFPSSIYEVLDYRDGFFLLRHRN